MIYDFACKIKDIGRTDSLNEEALGVLVTEINQKFGESIDLKFVLPAMDQSAEVLVKGQSSVSSMPALHDKELEWALESFRSYLEAIADALEGEVSKNDGFYNNSKTFKRLYS